MKLLCIALTLIVAVSSSKVDWTKVEPLEVFPNIHAELPKHHKPSVEGRIAGGEEVKPHSLPYQVGLMLPIGDKNAWCGGSLISNQYVLTAAHCAEQADGAVVYLGAHNIKEENPTFPQVKVPKENLIVHEDWSRLTLTNDIALIKLPEPIEFNENIQPINLPRKSQRNELFVGTTVLASGWGKDSDKATAVSPVLRAVSAPVITKLSCTLRYFGVIKDTHICMNGKGGKSTCQGDSGGPMAVTEEDGSKTLIGATSFGISFGCEIGWPGVFTRITSYLDWISQKTGIELRD